MEDILLYAGIISFLTLALVEVVKRTTTIRKNLMPLLSLGIGLLVGAMALFVPEITSDLSIGGHLLAGAITGLSASGIYDVATKTTKSKGAGGETNNIKK